MSYFLQAINKLQNSYTIALREIFGKCVLFVRIQNSVYCIKTPRVVLAL
jgi:hypothetical protein